MGPQTGGAHIGGAHTGGAHFIIGAHTTGGTIAAGPQAILGPHAGGEQSKQSISLSTTLNGNPITPVTMLNAPENIFVRGPGSHDGGGQGGGPHMGCGPHIGGGHMGVLHTGPPAKVGAEMAITIMPTIKTLTSSLAFIHDSFHTSFSRSPFTPWRNKISLLKKCLVGR